MWTPIVQEQVYGEIEPHNLVDKYALTVKKVEKVVGHLPLGGNGKFAKTILYFLRAEPYGKWKGSEFRLWRWNAGALYSALMRAKVHGGDTKTAEDDLKS